MDVVIAPDIPSRFGCTDAWYQCAKTTDGDTVTLAKLILHDLQRGIDDRFTDGRR